MIRVTTAPRAPEPDVRIPNRSAAVASPRASLKMPVRLDEIPIDSWMTRGSRPRAIATKNSDSIWEIALARAIGLTVERAFLPTFTIIEYNRTPIAPISATKKNDQIRGCHVDGKMPPT